MILSDTMTEKKRRPPIKSDIGQVRRDLRSALAKIEQIAPEGAQPVELTTVQEVIKHVYGKGANLARRCDVSLPTINDWKNQGWFATNTYALMSEDLAAKGYTAPKSLWRMKE